MPHAECIYKSDLFGKRIGIVGDSFFTTKDGFGNLENILELTFHASINKITIFRANDFVKCGKDTKLKVMTSLTKGEYNKIINNHSNSETKSVILYTLVGKSLRKMAIYDFGSCFMKECLLSLMLTIMWFDALQ